MTTSKSDLRRRVRALEDALTAEELRESGARLVSRLMACPEYRRARCVFLYLGVGPEPDTRPLISDALKGGKRVALPKITAPGVMEAREIASLKELVPDRFAIPAPPVGSAVLPPESFDLILVPGSAFSPDGGRLGRGGGYYDRYLPETRGVRVALARDIQLFERVPMEPHDVPVDILITE